MNKRQGMLLAGLAVLMLAGCGQGNQQGAPSNVQDSGQTASATGANVSGANNDSVAKAADLGVAEAGKADAPVDTSTVDGQQAAGLVAANTNGTDAAAPSKQPAPAVIAPTNAKAPMTITAAPQTVLRPQTTSSQGKVADKAAESTAVVSPAASGSSQSSASVKSAAAPKASTVTAGAVASTNKKPAGPQKVSPDGNPIVSFGEFFDGDDRTTPSDKFWDLSGKQVEIKGFMGEVLSLDKHWFLLIPAPGAECPFDNGDGTLWNEIMIVFVKDGESLRYTRGPLKIIGTLDVGVKVDQSGYRTMFRMQNATFAPLEE